MDIFPVINCPEESCFRERMMIVKQLPFIGKKAVHIDISDGVFADSSTWISPEALRKEILNSDVEFTVHLMLQSPEVAIDEWIRSGAKEVIIHSESNFDPDRIVDICSKNEVRATLAAKPSTSIDLLLRYQDHFSRFLLLAVDPGPAGQPMSSEVIPRIGELRAALPDATIEVDGGVMPETVRLIKQAGADIAVAGTYIFLDMNPVAAYLRLVELAK